MAFEVACTTSSRRLPHSCHSRSRRRTLMSASSSSSSSVFSAFLVQRRRRVPAAVGGESLCHNSYSTFRSRRIGIAQATSWPAGERSLQRNRWREVPRRGRKACVHAADATRPGASGQQTQQPPPQQQKQKYTTKGGRVYDDPTASGDFDNDLVGCPPSAGSENAVWNFFLGRHFQARDVKKAARALFGFLAQITGRTSSTSARESSSVRRRADDEPE